jgi:membrane protein YqaA with SNARE-associated domain
MLLPAPALSLWLLYAGQTMWRWLYRLGGVGLILLGLADNSAVPLPGSMDALTIVLAGHQREWWWYYALMATAGAMLGGYLTYRLARAGGKEVLEKKIGKQRAQKVYAKFERAGFSSIAVGAMIPPPFPILPVLLSAGAMQYPRKKFLAALALGRGVRFTLVAYIASRYGRHIFRFFSQYYKPALWTLIALAVVGGVVALSFYLRHRQKKKQERLAPARHKAA